MPVHQELGLTTQHGLDHCPDDLLDFLRDLKHLTQLNSGLSACLQNSSEKEIVWQNLLLVLILRPIIISLFLHVVKDLDDTRPSLPCKLTDDSHFDLSKLILNFVWHIRIKLQEYV
jgi:hypothetical protein